VGSSIVEVTDAGRLEAMLERLPLVLRGKTLERALSAAAKPVIEMAKSLCPDSYITGTRELWSAKTKAERASVKQLKDTITSVVRDYGERKVLVVGPAYPAGALGHLVEFSRRKILWGRDSGIETRGKPFLRPAAQITKDEQRSALVKVLESAARKAARMEAV
jgi:hypothetical protein